ncbi:MAG TPA: NADH-quinone oxidoreductase subunit J [Anaerolineales bacterium]|nr:NADH-quinone oxidoreductase subunit J [Anaerolineales bacterium]
MTALQFIFLALGLATLVCAAMVVTSPQLVHAALWLIATLACVAALFVLLEAGFLAAVQVVVYIGAIAILIIFAAMLTRRVMAETGGQTNRTWWAAVFASALLFISLVALMREVPAWQTAVSAPLPLAPEPLLEDLGQALVDVNRYVIPFEVASVLLLAALVGAIVIARPSRKTEEGGPS